MTLTSFVGRAAERRELAAALGENRLVSAVGPGGVGKTRLALAVAADVSDRFPDGTAYVDLVRVGDPALIAGALLRALGLSAQQSASAQDTVLGWLAERQCLVLLDNCEHLLDGVGGFVEQLLTACARLVVLVTSRARLQLPFERVFAVPGLSVTSDEGGGGDAVALFEVRAADAGRPTTPVERERLAVLCRGLDGTALAIELAAARLPVLGLDGLETGLADPLRVLGGSSRADRRHRSLRATLDWSYALLTPIEQAVLRRVSVFAGPFGVDPAQRVAGDWDPSAVGDVPAALAVLADHSLLDVDALAGPARYRVLETIRQYGRELQVTAGERAAAMGRYVSWCRQAGSELAAAVDPESTSWRAAFDEIVDDLRTALSWAAVRGDHRADAYALAATLAELAFARGLPGEAQHRSVEAADLAFDDRAAAEALRRAAGAALTGHVDEEALDLLRRAADAALAAGDRAGAGRDLARAAELLHRFGGPGSAGTPQRAAALLAEARPLAGGSPSAQAQVRVAEAYALPELDPEVSEVAADAAVLARAAAEPVIESAALSRITAVHLARGAVAAAAACSQHRARVDTRSLADEFRHGWDRAGRPRTRTLRVTAYTVATVHGMCGDERSRAAWLDVVDGLHPGLRSPEERQLEHFFDAWLLLHQGRSAAAADLLELPPEHFRTWYNGRWRTWYAAMWAEAAVLSGRRDTAEALTRARPLAQDNPIAAAILARTAAVEAGDTARLVAAAAELESTGCRYQWARTLAFAGGSEGERGQAALAAIGATPMTPPVLGEATGH